MKCCENCKYYKAINGKGDCLKKQDEVYKDYFCPKWKHQDFKSFEDLGFEKTTDREFTYFTKGLIVIAFDHLAKEFKIYKSDKRHSSTWLRLDEYYAIKDYIKNYF